MKAIKVVPLAGTWIETSAAKADENPQHVVPLAGTWIETHIRQKKTRLFFVVPLAGTWIETVYKSAHVQGDKPVVPLAGTWIETCNLSECRSRKGRRSPRGNVD